MERNGSTFNDIYVPYFVFIVYGPMMDLAELVMHIIKFYIVVSTKQKHIAIESEYRRVYIYSQFYSFIRVKDKHIINWFLILLQQCFIYYR